MSEIIRIHHDLCTGCNRCVRECPMELANITYRDEQDCIKVRIDHERCITCGRCITACKHAARYFEDDTARFFEDLSKGIPLSLIVAPAIRTNIPDYKRLFTYLKQRGVNKIYDVSLGADICTWAHIRHIEKAGATRLITQPCPVIVRYCEIYQHGLLKNLSPVHSPMGCISVYIKKYEGLTDGLAALSPCVAKTHEFEDTGLAQYNVTFSRMQGYLKENNIELPEKETDFDHIPSGLGSMFPMPGGLKQNIEFFLGKQISIDNEEGHYVYDRLNAYSESPEELLPHIYDVLNCHEGCNLGTAASRSDNIFEINREMDKNRDAATGDRDKKYFESLHKAYDETFDISHFMREYQATSTVFPQITDEDIEKAFILLGKTDYEKQNVDCGACGSETCHNMARKIALDVNIPSNCMVRVTEEAKGEHEKNVIALEQFESIWNNVQSSILIIDVRTREIIDANPAAVRLYGGEKEDMLHKPCHTFFAHEICPILDAGNDMDRAEREFIKADGTVIPIFKSAVQSSYNGRAVLLESFADISHLKKAEEQRNMLEVAERVQVILDASPLCITFFDKDFRLIDCNEGAAKIFNLSGKREYLERFSELSPAFQPDGKLSSEKTVTVISEAFETGHNRFKWMHQMLNGRPLPVEVDLVRVHYRGETLVAGYARDLREHNKMMADIEQRDNLLNTVNLATSVLLAADSVEDIGASILKSMEIIGHSVDADRVQIWRNETINGELHFVHTYEWLSNIGKKKTPVPMGLKFPYRAKPEWEAMFLRGEYINAPLSEMQAEDKAFLSAYDMKSIVIIPLFLQERFWGFFSVDDCVVERKFTADEINILRSASLMMASALLRDDIMRNIRDTAAKLDAVIANYTGIIWSADKNGTINLFNGLYLKEIGVEPSFLEGKNLEVARLKNRHLDIIERARQTLVENQPQDWISDIDGKSFHARIMPIHDENGEVSSVVGSVDDVTEMIELQNKLKKENINALEQFEMIWDKVEAGMLIIDAETRVVVDANPAAVRMFGDTKERIVGQMCFKFFGQHECPILDLNQIVDREERKFTRADGSVIPVLKSVSSIRYNGRLSFLESFTDISYMKEADEKTHMLALSERMQVMLDANPHINLLFDSSFNVIDCNPAALKFLGFETKEELMAEFVERMTKSIPAFQPDGRPSVPLPARLMTAVKEGSVRFETEVVMAGVRRNLDVQFKKIPHNSSFAIVGYIYDMTEIHEREMELMRARELNEIQLVKLNLAAQATKIGLWDMEITSDDLVNPENTFMWSDEFRHMLGFTDENDFPNIFKSWMDRVHPEDKDKAISTFADHLLDKTGQTSYDQEYRLLKKNGEYSYYRASGKAIRDEEGNALRVAGALMDITETKNILLDTERQRIEAQAANKAKSAFLSTMSHEIRTPMNAILGITEIQLQNDTLDQNVREALDKIHVSGDMLLGIINDILDLSKIEAGKLELVIAKYEIASLISDTAQLNMMRIGSKPIEFELQIDENTPLYVLGDELRVKQILNNILSNAFKYTASGMVRLLVSAEPNSEAEADVTLVFSVSDTGQGMTKEQITRLFDEYSRFNMEANRSTEGTGLGMSITQNLVRLMNGEIFIESEPGKGSTFTIRLPQGRVGSEVLGKELTENLHQFRTRSRAQMRRTQIARDPMPYGSVLVVDDVETNIYVARGLLLPYSLKIDAADSGFAAIEKIKGGNVYDIVFMDHMMPKMDGIEATKIIRSMGYAEPIVALTANAVAGQADIFLGNGFDDFISKPIDVRQLNNVLNKLIRDKYPLEALEEVRKEVGAEVGARKEAGAGKEAVKEAGARKEAAKEAGARKEAGAEKEQPLETASFFAVNPRFAEIFARDALKSLAVLEVLDKKGSFDDDDMRTYVIHTHGMKGALANIGKMELSAVALRLEMLGRDGDTEAMLSETPAFLELLQAFVDEIMPQKDDVDETAEEDVSYLREKLYAVKAACEDYDEKAAEDILAELGKQTWSAETRKLLGILAEHLLHSDFDEIVTAITELYASAKA